jgi:hypothetical protein
MPVKCTLAFQKTVVFYPDVELDRQNPVGILFGVFWRKRSTLITYCFQKAVVYPGEWLGSRWPHHKMYGRNYVSNTVVHPRLDATCRNLPKLSECIDQWADGIEPILSTIHVVQHYSWKSSIYAVFIKYFIWSFTFLAFFKNLLLWIYEYRAHYLKVNVATSF